MAPRAGLGEFFGSLGSIQDSTLAFVQAEKERQAREAYQQSLMGQAAQRLALEVAKMHQPQFFGPGTFMMPPGGGPAAQVTPFAPSREQRTLEQIREEAKARAEGAAAVKPPKEGKSLQDIEAEAAARARGTASVKPEHGPMEPRPSYEQSQIREALRAKLGREPTAAEFVAEEQRIKNPPSILTSENLDFPAWRYLMTGQLPFLGFGKAGAREQIIKRADEIRKEMGLSPTGTLATGADLASTTAALKNLTTREALTDTFIRKIEENVKTIREYQKRYKGNEFYRIFNLAQNNIVRGIKGSGDLAALQLALMSTSREVAKVESGSLGIAEASVQAQQIMDRLHDVNLPPQELEKVLQASIDLGGNARRALQAQRAELKQRITDLGRTPESAPPAAPPSIRTVGPGLKPRANPGEEVRRGKDGKYYVRRNGKLMEVGAP